MRKLFVFIGAVAMLGLASTTQGSEFDKKAQVTLGGAQTFITGYITKVEDDGYWIQSKEGDETRVRVTDATNMICRTRDEARKTAIEERKPGMGFRIGDCPLMRGEVVKAEVSDEGEATMIRYLEGQLLSQTKELGLPQDFGVLAVPQGLLEFTETPPYAVRALDGASYGTLMGSVTDSQLGTAYAVILREEDKYYYPMPWEKVKFTFPSAGKEPVVVVLETTETLHGMYPPLFTAKTRIDIASLRDYWAQKGAPVPVVKKELDLDIVIKSKEFHLLKDTVPGKKNIEFHAGTEPTIRIVNEDIVTHEFVSPVFKEVGFSFEGKATLVTTPRATGVRIAPGEMVFLTMKLPSTFEPMYGLFWCSIHGKEHGDKMRGEVLVFETRGGEFPDS